MEPFYVAPQANMMGPPKRENKKGIDQSHTTMKPNMILELTDRKT
jgi:hypothetical protein